MIYEIREDGERYSIHLTQVEAESYTEHLRKVYPTNEWEIHPLSTGRLRGQEEMLWGSEGLIDTLSLTMHQFMKVYLWRGMKWTPPTLHSEIYRYIPMNFEVTLETEAVAEAKRRLKGMQFKEIEGFADRVVRIE